LDAPGQLPAARRPDPGGHTKASQLTSPQRHHDKPVDLRINPPVHSTAPPLWLPDHRHTVAEVVEPATPTPAPATQDDHPGRPPALPANTRAAGWARSVEMSWPAVGAGARHGGDRVERRWFCRTRVGGCVPTDDLDGRETAMIGRLGSVVLDCPDPHALA